MTTLPADSAIGTGDSLMPNYHSPELIQTMRAVLEEATSKIPLDQSAPGIKAHLAECILKAAADGETSYEGLLIAAFRKIGPILSVRTVPR
jgi:hypothetical protein